MSRRNQEVAHLLDNIAELLAIEGESPFRIRAYANTARHVDAMAEDIEAVYVAGQLDAIPGVGESIAEKIGEFLETGRLAYYEQLEREIQLAAGSLLEVPGIGPVRAHRLYGELEITSVSDLLTAARRPPARSAWIRSRAGRDDRPRGGSAETALPTHAAGDGAAGQRGDLA